MEEQDADPELSKNEMERSQQEDKRENEDIITMELTEIVF
jgi:hypothetical protein